MLYPQKVYHLIDKFLPNYTWRKEGDEQKIYLTFDDGPHPEITRWVLSVLKEFDFRATFFCVGENAQKYPDVLKEIIDGGHSLGNHTFNHLKGWNTDTDTYIQNVNKCREVVDSKLFRPPYGRIKQSQAKILKEEYSIIMWTLLSGDFYPKLDLPKAIEQLKGKTTNGQIVVFHDSLKAEKNLRFLLPKYCKFLKEQGLSSERI